MPTTPPNHGIAGDSAQTGAPVARHLEVEIIRSGHNGPAGAGESDAR